jgi:hypothetical protein
MLNHIRNVITASRPLSYLAHGIGVVTVGAVLALCAMNAGAQVNGATTHFQGTFTAFMPDSCTGELLDVTFSFDLVFHDFIDSNGEEHTLTHETYSVQGVGETTGAVYTGKEIDNGTENVKPGVTGNFSEVGHITMTGGGSTLVFGFHQHITLNTNGTVTSSFDDFDIRCD